MTYDRLKFSREAIRQALAKDAEKEDLVYIPARYTGGPGPIKPKEPKETEKSGKPKSKRLTPEEIQATLGEFRQEKWEEPNPFFKTFPIEDYHPGGRYFSTKAREDRTGRSYGSGTIDVTSGKPKMVFDTEPTAPSTEGRVVKINLIKRKGEAGGWSWAETPYLNTEYIISVVQAGNHFYGLKADITSNVELAVYPGSSTEPKGKPTIAKGKIELGNEISKIKINRKIHPLYDTIKIVRQTESTKSSEPKQAEHQMKLSDSKFIRRSMEERTVVKERERFHADDASALRGIFDKHHREARMMFPEASGSYEAVSFHDPDNGLRRYGYVIGEGQGDTARVELGDGEYMDVPHEELRRLGSQHNSSHLKMQLRAAFGGVTTDTDGLRADMHDRFAPLAVDPSNSIELLSVGYSTSVGMPTNNEIGSYVAHFHPTARLLDVDDSMPGLLGLSVQRVAEHEVEAEMGPAAGGEVTEVFDPQDEDDYEAGLEVEAADGDLKGACWPKYKPVGLKKGKGGRMVPNCIPKESEGNVGPKGRPAGRASDAALADFHKVAPPGQGQTRQAQVVKNLLQGISDVAQRYMRSKQRGYPTKNPSDYAGMAQVMVERRLNEQAAYVLRKYFESGGSQAGYYFIEEAGIDEKTKLALLAAALQNYEKIDRQGYASLASKLLPGLRGQEQAGQGAAGGLDQRRKQELRQEHPVITEEFIKAIKAQLEDDMRTPGKVNPYKLAEFSKNMKRQLDTAVGGSTENFGWDEGDIYKQVQQAFAELSGQAAKTQSRPDYDAAIIDIFDDLATSSIERGQQMPSLQVVKQTLSSKLQLPAGESLEQYGWSDKRIVEEFQKSYVEHRTQMTEATKAIVNRDLTMLLKYLTSPNADINDPNLRQYLQKYKIQNTTNAFQAANEIKQLLANPVQAINRFRAP